MAPITVDLFEMTYKNFFDTILQSVKFTLNDNIGIKHGFSWINCQVPREVLKTEAQVSHLFNITQVRTSFDLGSTQMTPTIQACT